MADAWEQIDSWIRPKLVDAVPKHVKDWVVRRTNLGETDPTHVVVFYLMKSFSPDSPEEKKQLYDAIVNPPVCSNPQAAQTGLIQWMASVRRYAVLGCQPPDLSLIHI